MTNLEWIRLVVGIVFLLIGMHLFLLQVYGVFKLKYVLNRMHAAAMGDTLGIGSSLVGIMFISGWNFTTLKLCLVLAFLWCSSPVASHLISRLQAITDEELDQHCEYNEEVKNRLEKLIEQEDE